MSSRIALPSSRGSLPRQRGKVDRTSGGRCALPDFTDLARPPPGVVGGQEGREGGQRARRPCTSLIHEYDRFEYGGLPARVCSSLAEYALDAPAWKYHW